MMVVRNKSDCKNCIHSRTVRTTNETYIVCVNDMMKLSFPSYEGKCVFERKEK